MVNSRLDIDRTGVAAGDRVAIPLVAIALLLWAALPQKAQAGDWPQLLGPLRNGVAAGETLAPWPESGPETRWTQTVGLGYAGPIVVGDAVIVFHRKEDRDILQAFEAATGRSRWTANFPAKYAGGVNPDTGPRCTPLAHEGKVFALSAAGDLHAVDLKTGKPLWSRGLHADFNADEGYFGAGSTPIVIGGKLLANVGGKDAGLVAFDPATGETLWKATDERASYSSPIAVTLGGRTLAVFVTRLKCVAVDPANGAVRFDFPFGSRGPTVNAATPLFLEGRLFLSASYGVGARLVDLRGGRPQPVWEKDGVMSSQYTTCVHHDGYLYGSDGREDVGVARLRCVKAATGEVAWSEDDFGVAHVLLAGDKLLILGVDGRLMLAQATPTAFRPLATARIFGDAVRALPALSSGRLFARDTSSTGGLLKCVVVGER